MGFSKIRIPRKIKQYQMLVKFGLLDLFYCQATDTLQRFLIKHIPFTAVFVRWTRRWTYKDTFKKGLRRVVIFYVKQT